MDLKTALSYARYSSDNQHEESVTAQLRENREFAEREGIVIIKEYFDEAKSASIFATKRRDDFDNMIDDVFEGRIKPDYIIFNKVDRFARNDLDFAVTRYKLRTKKVKYLYATQKIPEGPEGIILERVLEALAEYYSADLSKNVRRGMKERALAAKYHGGSVPFGYTVGPDKKYQIHEAQAEKVREAYNLTYQGESYYFVETKTGIKVTTLHGILRNPFYNGTYRAGKYSGDKEIIELPGAVPAIVEMQLWEEVQAKLDNRKHVYPRTKQGGQLYLLTGKVVCGECGSAYTGSSRMGGRNKTSRYSVYGCTARRKKTCDNPDIQKDILESLVLDKIESQFNSANVETLVDLVIEKWDKRSGESISEIAKLKTAIADTTKKLNNLIGAIESGYMEASVAGPRINALSKDKEVLMGNLKLLESTNGPVLNRTQIQDFIKQNQQVLNDRSDLLACKRLIDHYVDSIKLFKDTVDIVYKVAKDSGKDVFRMVDPKVSVKYTRPPARSESWINKFVAYD